MNDSNDIKSRLVIREFGLNNYVPIYKKMCEFSANRQSETTDEFWVLEHNPVYTLGLNGHKEHILDSNDIPIVKVDRGGQVTFHGPGQLIIYLLIDVKRKKMGVRAIVTAMENAIIQMLHELGVHAFAKKDAPGVYVDQKKIAALGLRIKNGKSYHGLSLNIDMDLTPFNGINPCGYENLEVTQIKELIPNVDKSDIKTSLVQALMNELEYSTIEKKLHYE